MSRPRVIASRLRGLLDRRRPERELDDEVRFHLEMQIDDNVRAGMSPHEARAAALRSFGGIEPMKELHRDRRSLPILETAARDLRYAFRALRKSPAFTATAAAVLALAIGANTAMFSVIDAVLLRSLPFPDADALTYVYSSSPSKILRELTPGRDVEEWRRQSRTFAAFAVMDGASVTLTTPAGAERVGAARVSPEYFDIFGVQPMQGRTFTQAEAAARERLAVISYRLWQSRFAGSPNAIGASIQVDGAPVTIIGVLPASFQRLNDRDLWEPHTAWKGDSWTVLGRLRPGVRIEQAQTELTAIAGRLDEQLPLPNRTRGVSIVPLERIVVGAAPRMSLWMLAGAVLCVLLIAATNIASLSIARAAARSREIAIRSALGASGARIAGQLLAESLALTTFAGLLGLAVADALLRVVVAISPAGLARIDEVRLDPRALAATAALCLLTAIGIGLAPVLSTSRGRSTPLAGRGIAGSASTRGARRALVVAQFALAVVLLAGGGLLLRSLWAVESVRPGFNPGRVVSVAVAASSLPSDRHRVDFYRRVLDELAALPGVESAGFMSDLFVGGGGERLVTLDGAAPVRLRIRSDEATPTAFATLQVPLLRGRFFTDADNPAAPRVAILNDTMARSLWPSADPVGRRFRFDTGESAGVWFTVVGVVGDMRRQGLETETAPQMFEPVAQKTPRLSVLLVRTSKDDPLQMVPAIQATIRRIDKQAPVYGVATVADRLAADLAPRRFNAGLLIGFSAMALLIAAVGIYGLIQYSIAMRTHEIGIRIAVGAGASAIFGMVIGEGLKLSLIGLAVGLAAALAAGRAASGLLYGVTSGDPVTYIAVAILLTSVAAGACYFPARRAMKVDPLSALRQD